jgi:hypothetical protein
MKDTELEYKNYSLSNLNDWISDALNSEATPEEIYATIVNCVERDVEYHDACVKQAKQLLSLLKGREISNFDDKITFSPYNDDVINFPSRY